VEEFEGHKRIRLKINFEPEMSKVLGKTCSCQRSKMVPFTKKQILNTCIAELKQYNPSIEGDCVCIDAKYTDAMTLIKENRYVSYELV